MERSNKGFSLVELLAVVAIIGVLVTLALPRYKAFIARARQGEAKHNLGTISKLQEAYWMHKAGLNTTGSFYSMSGQYGGNADNCKEAAAADPGTNALGFRLTDCRKARYAYTLSTSNDTAQGGKGALAKKLEHAIYPDCGDKDIDVWTIAKNTRQLSQTKDAVNECKG